VKNGKGGNIYVFVRVDKLGEPYTDMFRRFHTLPFAARWCSRYNDYTHILERGVKMVEKLNELGIGIKMETVKDIAGEASIGRPHVADALLRGEYVRSYDEAFARYLGYHAPAYVPKYRLSPEEAIDLIHSVNGLAVIAHPGLLHRDDLIPKFVELGLDGLEAFHPQHGYYVTNHYIDLAKRYGLLYTGGSDCHGERKGRALIGTVKMPYSCLEALRRRRKELGKGRAGNLAV